MKLIIEKNDLVPMLSTLKHGISSNAIIPILENIKIYTKDGLLQMQSSDNNLTVTIAKSFSDKLSLDSDYSFLLHSSAIPLLTQLKDGQIQIEANPDQNMVKISQGKNTYKFGMEDVKDYIGEDKAEYEAVCELDFAVFKEALINSLVFVSSTFNNMMGMLLEIENGKITIVATDAHILLRTVISCESTAEENYKMIIPPRIVTTLKNIKYSGKITIAASDNNCKFSFGETVLKQRLIDENYPQYHSVIPATFDTTIKVKKAEFVESLKRLSILSNKITSGQIMVFNDTKLCIIAADADKGTDGKEFLLCESETETPKFIAFNESYMSSVMPCLVGDNIDISLSRGDKGAMIINEHTEDSLKTILVMPIMVHETIEELQKLLF